MYLDREKSQKIKQIKINNPKIINVTKNIAITLSLALLIATANINELSREPLNDTGYYQIDLDKDYQSFCDDGAILVESENPGKYYLYQIQDLFLYSEKVDNLNENYYLARIQDLKKDLITGNDIPEYKKNKLNLFGQSSIMYKIYYDNIDNIEENEGHYNIKLTKEQFNNYIKNWDGKIYVTKSKTK